MRRYELDWYLIPQDERRARRYFHVPIHEIKHSGCVFSTNVETTIPEWGAVPVWPIEELLARADYAPQQAQRIRKMNKYGKPEADGCVCFVPPKQSHTCPTQNHS